jgi:hypothetical protein
MRGHRFFALAALAGLLASAIAPVPAAETKTAKERLVSKAADEQRVNNCNVPPELWGPVKRPGCPSQETASAPGNTGDGQTPPPTTQ